MEESGRLESGQGDGAMASTGDGVIAGSSEHAEPEEKEEPAVDGKAVVSEFSEMVDEYFSGMHTMADTIRKFIKAKDVLETDPIPNAEANKKLWDEFYRILFWPTSEDLSQGLSPRDPDEPVEDLVFPLSLK